MVRRWLATVLCFGVLAGCGGDTGQDTADACGDHPEQSSECTEEHFRELEEEQQAELEELQEPPEAPPEIPSYEDVCQDRYRVTWSKAASRAGKLTAVSGRVVSVNYQLDEQGSPTFLNIGRDYPNAKRFTAVVWGKNRSKFADEPLEGFEGRSVCVIGYVRLYRGLAQMDLPDPDPIAVRR